MDVLDPDTLVCVARHVIGHRFRDQNAFRDAVSFAQTSTAMCGAMRRALRPYTSRAWYGCKPVSYEPISGFAHAFLFLFDASAPDASQFLMMRLHCTLMRGMYGDGFVESVHALVEKMNRFLSRATSHPAGAKSNVLKRLLSTRAHPFNP